GAVRTPTSVQPLISVAQGPVSGPSATEIRRDEVGGEVAEGDEDEVSLPHAGVGDDEVGLVHHQVTHKEYVHVERARAPALGPYPPGFGLQSPSDTEQVAGRQLRVQLDHAVEVRRLARQAAHRL